MIYARVDKRWKLLRHEKPSEYRDYPVAIFVGGDVFDDIIVISAQFYPDGRWVTVEGGDVVRPFAWYDLPAPPAPLA